MYILSDLTDEILTEVKEKKDEETIANFWLALMKHHQFCLMEAIKFPQVYVLNNFWGEYALVLVTMQCDNTGEENGHLADTFIEMVVPDASLYDLC